MPVKQPKPKPVGRPRLAEHHAKSSIMPIRLNAADREKVETAAAKTGVSVSEWVRRTLHAAL